ncbi:MAG: universal stress protein [Cyanobacteria bacterium P01_G01_bin.39]
MSLFSKNRVLFPTDFSELATSAQQQTLEFVGDPTHLHIVHVLSPLSALEPGIVWDKVNDQTRKHNVEQTFRAKFNTPEYGLVNFEVLFGKISQNIINYAQSNNIELIVIPANNNNSFNPLLLGSVTERVVRHAHCPVYVWRSL